MKITLDKVERNYLYGLFKLLAVGAPVKEHQDFYLSLAERVAPNRLYGEFNKEEVRLLLDIITDAMTKCKQALEKKLPAGHKERAEVLDKVLVGAKSKLESKLAIVERKQSEESKNGI